MSLCRASRVCCRRGVKILQREPTTLFYLLLLLRRKVVAFQKSESKLTTALSHSPHRATRANDQDSSNRKHTTASPPPLKHDGVTSRRAGAIPQRHAHAPLAGLRQPRVAHSRDTISVLGPSRKARDCVRVCEAVPNIYAGPSTRRSPASFMTRGYQCGKVYYIVLANARFMYIAWELATLLSNVETCSTSWSFRVSQARSLGNECGPHSLHSPTGH